MTAQAIIGILVIFVGLPVCILHLGDALRNRRLAKQRKLRGPEPLALPYRVAYTSTRQDLLDAHRADTWRKSGLSPLFLFFYLLLGILWACAPIWIFVVKSANLSVASVLIWLGGCAIVWRTLIRPWLERNRIKRESAPAQEVALEFSEQGIMARNSAVGEFHHPWSEVMDAALCDKGLLVYFADGVCNLLPKRTFPQPQEMLKLHAFIQEQMFEAEEE